MAKLASLGSPLLSLEVSLQSGQAFHWVREGDGWLGAVGGQAVYLEQRAGELWVNSEGAAAARVRVSRR